jgi:peptidoglycan-associated lipoprotein
LSRPQVEPIVQETFGNEIKPPRPSGNPVYARYLLPMISLNPWRGSINMRVSLGTKLIALIAGGLLLAACESKTDTPPATTGSGGTGSQAAAPAQPAGPTPGSAQDFILNVGDRVFFDFDRYDLKPAATATLARQAAWLKQYQNRTITIEGHADERGTREYNLALGERRANSVKNYLISQGVSADRIKTISYGKERPVALGHNEAAWSQNRRAVTVVN